MSEVLKLDIMGVMNQIHLAFKPTEICGEALKFVLASDYDALAAQRDEGLAREAELLEQRDSLANEMFDLQQRLAEAKELLTDLCDTAYIQSNEGADAYDAARKFLASPGCADEDPESSWENNFGPDYEVDISGSILEADRVLPVRDGYCQCGRLVDRSQVGHGCADGEKVE